MTTLQIGAASPRNSSRNCQSARRII